MVTTYRVGCLPGTYENVRVGCDDCRLDTWSRPESAACDMCARTFYDVRGPDADRSAWPAVGDCRRCPPEADCASPDTRLEALPLQPGYMRMAADSTELLRCRVRAACPGGYFGVGVRSCSAPVISGRHHSCHSEKDREIRPDCFDASGRPSERRSEPATKDSSAVRPAMGTVPITQFSRTRLT